MPFRTEFEFIDFEWGYTVGQGTAFIGDKKYLISPVREHRQIIINIYADKVLIGTKVLMSGPRDWVNDYIRGKFPMQDADKYLENLKRS